MKLNNSKTFGIFVPIYEAMVIVSYNTSQDTLIKALKKDEVCDEKDILMFELAKEEYAPTPKGAITIEMGSVFIVDISKHDNIYSLHNAIAHELFHVVHLLLEQKGFKLTDESQEAYSYLIGYLTEEIYREWI